jgi:enamine deaminase RidA (YjgF/YER057c/UK114 family)
MTGKIETRIKEIGIELPVAAAPVANYVPWVISGNQIYIAGQVPRWNGEFLHVGRIGAELSVEDGQKAARLCALNIMAHVKSALGDLDRVKRCVKLNVFVRSSAEFSEQPKVANGASDLMVEVFGDIGKHARSAVGVMQLPFGVSVEVDAVFEFA